VSSSTTDAIVAAAVTVVAVSVGAWLVDRALRRVEGRAVRAMPGDTAAAHTSWTLLRRVTVALILVVGIGTALLKTPFASNLAKLGLASSAVFAVIFGLAAQSTLSNIVAGILLALNQPIRIGDRVRIEGASGVVETIGWSSTVLRADDGRRLIFPNSVLAQRMVENESITDARRRASVRVPVRLGSDLERLRARLAEVAAERGLGDPEVEVAELERDGAVLELRGWVENWTVGRTVEDDLRAAVADLLAEERA
jgi:small conductance mechanosensitive channel